MAVYAPRFLPSSWVSNDKDAEGHGHGDGIDISGSDADLTTSAVEEPEFNGEIELLGIPSSTGRKTASEMAKGADMQVYSDDQAREGKHRRSSNEESGSGHLLGRSAAAVELDAMEGALDSTVRPRTQSVGDTHKVIRRRDDGDKPHGDALSQQTIIQRRAMRGQLAPLFFETLHPENPTDTHAIRQRSFTGGSDATSMPASLALGSTHDGEATQSSKRRDTMLSSGDFEDESAPLESPVEPVELRDRNVDNEIVQASLVRIDSDSVSTFPLARRRSSLQAGKRANAGEDEGREVEPAEEGWSAAGGLHHEGATTTTLDTDGEDNRGRDKKSFLSIERRERLKRGLIAALKVAFFIFEAPLREFCNNLKRTETHERYCATNLLILMSFCARTNTYAATRLCVCVHNSVSEGSCHASKIVKNVGRRVSHLSCAVHVPSVAVYRALFSPRVADGLVRFTRRNTRFSRLPIFHACTLHSYDIVCRNTVKVVAT